MNSHLSQVNCWGRKNRRRPAPPVVCELFFQYRGNTSAVDRLGWKKGSLETGNNRLGKNPVSREKKKMDCLIDLLPAVDALPRSRSPVVSTNVSYSETEGRSGKRQLNAERTHTENHMNEHFTQNCVPIDLYLDDIWVKVMRLRLE